MNYSETKWNQEEVEGLMKKHGWFFESNKKGCYHEAYIKFYGKKISMQLFVSKCSIRIEHWLRSEWKGIKSYKKLEEVLEYYNNSIKKDVWRSMSFSERVAYMAKKEYEEEDSTKTIENIVGALCSNINTNINLINEAMNCK